MYCADIKMQAVRAFSTAAAPRSRTVFVDGTRIPFALANTTYNKLIAQDLGRMAIKGLLTKTAFDPSKLDYVCMGTVIQEGVFSLTPATLSQRTLPLPDAAPVYVTSMCFLQSELVILQESRLWARVSRITCPHTQ
jgi:hypothetical protein